METQIPEKGSKELRKGRFSQKESLYFITTSCHNKQKYFLDKENVKIFFDTVDWLEEKRYIELYFCIAMPDHVHIVFQLTSDKTLSDVMKTMKQFTGKKIKKRARIESAVWQDQYYDHLIRKSESVYKIIEYCWYNPVRAGIVEHPKEYPYWRSKYELE